MTDSVVEILAPPSQTVEVLGGWSLEVISTESESADDSHYTIEIISGAVETVPLNAPSTVELLPSQTEVVLYGGAPGPPGEGIPTDGTAGDILVKASDGSAVWLAPEASTTFEISDWTGPFAGQYRFEFYHGLGVASPTVEVWSGGNIIETNRRIDNLNMITLLVPANPDLRFQGLVRVLRN